MNGKMIIGLAIALLAISCVVPMTSEDADAATSDRVSYVYVYYGECTIPDLSTHRRSVPSETPCQQRFQDFSRDTPYIINEGQARPFFPEHFRFPERCVPSGKKLRFRAPRRAVPIAPDSGEEPSGRSSKISVKDRDYPGNVLSIKEDFVFSAEKHYLCRALDTPNPFIPTGTKGKGQSQWFYT